MGIHSHIAVQLSLIGPIAKSWQQKRLLFSVSPPAPPPPAAPTRGCGARTVTTVSPPSTVSVNGYNAYVDEPKFGRPGKRDASGESYQRVWRVDGYDQVPTEYGVRVNGYNAVVDEDRVGRLGKRSTYGYTPALAYPPAGGYGYSKYGPGYSYEYRSPQGLRKREAEPSRYSYSYGVDSYDGSQYVERYQNDGYGYGYH